MRQSAQVISARTLSTHLAELYEVGPKVLVQAVKRNLKRFPEDFMFRLTWEEVNLLQSQSVISKEQSEPASRSQIVTLKRGKNVKHLPYAFTEQGVAMLSSVLRSDRAIHYPATPSRHLCFVAHLEEGRQHFGIPSVPRTSPVLGSRS